MHTLRPYQQETVDRMIWCVNLDGNSLVSLPVGAGKSHVIAEFVKRHGQPVLIFTPSKELLEQDVEKLSRVIDPADIGIFSASKGSKEVKKVTVATIQSAYKHPALFNHYRVVLIDEASGVNPKNLDGMYNMFFKALGTPKVIGLDATCFRLDSFYKPTGKPWQPYESVTTTKILTRYKERFWKQFVAVINTHQLIEKGYLSPLAYVDKSIIDHERIPTNISQSDFDLKAFEELFIPQEKIIVNDIVQGFTVHKSSLVFCSSIEQATRLSAAVTGSKVVSSKTQRKEREGIIWGFKNGSIKAVFNVNCLTKGFDHPGLDAIYMVRPTRSINLYCQMLGRGTRLSEGKKHCTVYDYSGNVKSIGTLESIKLEKIENKWNVTTTKFPRGAHLASLYSFKISAYDGRPKGEVIL